MISFNLRCANGHGFEAWFKDSATFDAQQASGEIACPICGDEQIVKAPMAPRIGKPTPSSAAEEKMAATITKMREQLVEMRKQVEEKCEHVGPRFAQEARRIHFGEVEHRDIYGEATEEEAEELEEEGVEFARVPWISNEN
ncbi:MAG: DUF1178 family protein [Pseudomonadota bacterium]